MERPELFVQEILRIARTGRLELGQENQYGRKYRVYDMLNGPLGSAPVVTVWIIPAGKEAPVLVTVYPKS